MALFLVPFLLWCLVNVGRECSVTLTYLCPNEFFHERSPSLPMSPLFTFLVPRHWLSAVRYCMFIVFLGWSEASTSFLSVSILWLPKGCYGVSYGLSTSLVYILAHAECALLQKVTWMHWDRITELALSLFPARPFRLMSMACCNSLPHFPLDESWIFRIIVESCSLLSFYKPIIKLWINKVFF